MKKLCKAIRFSRLVVVLCCGFCLSAQIALADSYLVTGIISHADGSTVPDCVVRVLVKSMQGSQQVGSAVTNSSGAYSIRFKAGSPITLVVSASTRNGLAAATSQPIHNANPTEAVDVTIAYVKKKEIKKGIRKK